MLNSYCDGGFDAPSESCGGGGLSPTVLINGGVFDATVEQDVQHYSLGEKKVMNIDISKLDKEFESDKVVGSSRGWVGLMKEEDDGRNSSLSLWNPTRGSRTTLPPLHTIPHFSKRRSEVKRLMVDDAECSRAIIVGKNSDCEEGSSSWLGVCCPGRCSEWVLFGSSSHSYEDVAACSQTRVYSVNTNWELARWDVTDPRWPRREWKKDIQNEFVGEKLRRRPDHHLLRYTYQHLVYAEQSGQVFIVNRHYIDPRSAKETEDLWKSGSGTYPNKTLAFDVHLLVENENEKEKELRYMEHSLDGLVMFVGMHNSFAVEAADFPHLKPDSIYFTDHVHTPKLLDGGHDIGIYDYKNRTISSCYYPALHRSFKGIRSYPYWLKG